MLWIVSYSYREGGETFEEFTTNLIEGVELLRIKDKNGQKVTIGHAV